MLRLNVTRFKLLFRGQYDHGIGDGLAEDGQVAEVYQAFQAHARSQEAAQGFPVIGTYKLVGDDEAKTTPVTQMGIAKPNKIGIEVSDSMIYIRIETL